MSIETGKAKKIKKDIENIKDFKTMKKEVVGSETETVEGPETGKKKTTTFKPTSWADYPKTKFKAEGGRVDLKHGSKKNTSRENKLEELGRVDAEKAFSKKGKSNLKSEKKRIVRELHAHGGSAGSKGAATHGFGIEIK